MTQAECKRRRRQRREEQGLCVNCGLRSPESPHSPRYRDRKPTLCEWCRTQARQAYRRCHRKRLTSKQRVRVERMMELVDRIVARFHAFT